MKKKKKRFSKIIYILNEYKLWLFENWYLFLQSPKKIYFIFDLKYKLIYNLLH